VKLEYFRRKDAGLDLYINWNPPEIICPTPEVSDFQQGASTTISKSTATASFAVVFGSKDMGKHKARLEKLGVEVGPLVDDHADSHGTTS